MVSFGRNRELLTQIYEVSTTEEARSVYAIGIDHIGILAGEGEFARELLLETAVRLLPLSGHPRSYQRYS